MARFHDAFGINASTLAARCAGGDQISKGVGMALADSLMTLERLREKLEGMGGRDHRGLYGAKLVDAVGGRSAAG